MATSRLELRGQFDGTNDRDCFSIELMAGQRYRFQIEGVDGANSLYANFVLRDAQGELLRSASGSTTAGSAGLVFVPESSGRYTLGLADLLGNDAARAYRLVVEAVAADEHPDSRLFAEPLALGQPVQGRFDEAGEIDSYALNLVKGQYLELRVDGSADLGGTLLRIEPRLYGPNGEALTLAMELPGFVTEPWRQKILVPETGSYVLSLRSGAGSLRGQPSWQGSYQLTVASSAVDDHADARELASRVTLGQALALELGTGNDVDWLRLPLTAGETLNMGLRRGGQSAGVSVELSLHDGAGRVLAESPGEELLFKAPSSGNYWLRIKHDAAADPSTGPLQFLAEHLNLSDEGSGSWDAVRLQPHVLQSGSHLHSGDTDWFVFEATAGQRYALQFNNPSGRQASQPRLLDANGAAIDSARPWLPDTANDGSSLKLFYEAARSGTVYVEMKPGGGTPALDGLPHYAILLSPANRDDHGDGPGTATPLALGQSLGLELEQGDSDVFRLDLQQGQRYRIEAHGAGPLFELTMRVDELGNTSSLTQAFGGLLFTPSQSGSQYVWARGVGQFQISLTALPGDDHGDIPALATDLGRLLPAGFSGQILQGSAAAESLSGGSNGDWLLGGAGNDLLRGGAGADVIDGGAGIDVALLAGRLGDYRLRVTPGHAQIEQRASGELDRLDQVERLRFEGGGPQLALDLEGHAGQVARLIGALFGAARLSDTTLVGLGLKALDGGMGMAELAAVAVDSELFAARAGSHSHADFVRTVYTNLFAKAPATAELQHYVGLLDSGVYTQAGLALLASGLEANALQIDLVGLAANGLAFVEP